MSKPIWHFIIKSSSFQFMHDSYSFAFCELPVLITDVGCCTPMPDIKMLTLLRMLTRHSWECWHDSFEHWWLGIFYSWPGEVRPILAGVGRSGNMTWDPDISGPGHFFETSCPVRSLCIEVSVSRLSIRQIKWKKMPGRFSLLIPSPPDPYILGRCVRT